ncbi:hypothetical protein KO02_16430 [Sphingobacterium sp. ML3W]|uniref:phage tail tape measure protein n=1 Tax=Sphingobacterium sp. ML3W TaxID=1538644 RepID=UPI0004F76BD2|nr:phage tail tape measure protein [Sphingobacterium sp. ML3W]AIM38094.1 hypothetical protein KO02_16430 [Sphingobacterium sp. ML3W]
MSNFITKWILEFGDKVTAPIKNMMKGVNAVTGSVDEMTDRIKYSEKEAKEALVNTKDHFNDLKAKIKENEAELGKLEKAYEKATPGRTKVAALAALEAQKKKVTELNTELQETEEDLKDINDQLDVMKKKDTNWNAMITGANQFAEIIGRVSDSLSFSVEIQTLTTDVQRMTDLSGAALDSFVMKSREIGDVYKQNSSEIAVAANAMTEQIGGTYEENLALIEEGFKRGANVNGDFLDQMKEYGPQIKALGISASDAIALIAKAGKDGVFSDKAIDALKEGGLAIREMGQTQIDALAGIGLKQKDLAGKTTMEALQIIAKGMKGATAQAKQLVLADIFKGAGEDAGAALIEGLANGMPKLEDLPAVEEAGAGFLRFWSNVTTKAGQIVGDVGIYAQKMGPFLQVLASIIPIVQTLTKATWLQTAAQKVLNFAMSMNPIGLIIAGITALITLIYFAIDSFDSWGSTVLAFMGPIGFLISGILLIKRHWDSIVEAFKSDGIIGAIKRIGIVLVDVIMHPLQRILGWVGELTGWKWAKESANAVEEFRKKNNLITVNETSEKKEKQTENKASVNDLIKADKLSFSPVKDKTKKGKGNGSSDGLNVGSGSGGIKSITINVSNIFNADKSVNIRDLADKVAGRIADRLQDAAINIGS